MDNKKEFIKTKCGHNVCYNCYKHLVQDKDYK